MKKHICIYLSLFLLAFISCEKTTGDSSNRSDRVIVEIKESILEKNSKSAITGSSFTSSSTFGLFICDHNTEDTNPYKEHSPLYNNIRAQLISGKWAFNYYGYSRFPTLFIVGKEDSEGQSISADVFAYSPYQNDIQSPEHIPFKIKDQNDMMYAVENNDPLKNKNIDPYIVENKIEVPLSFCHALTLLEFNISVQNEHYNHPTQDGLTYGYSLTNVSIRKNTDKDPSLIHLYSEGVMNAIDGSISSLTEVNEINIKPTASNINGSQNRNITARMLIIPSEPDDDEYIFKFTFSDVTIPTEFHLKKEHLRHGDSEVFGFKPGYKYTFNFVIDNYMRFDSVKFGEWTTIEEPIYQIEI